MSPFSPPTQSGWKLSVSRKNLSSHSVAIGENPSTKTHQRKRIISVDGTWDFQMQKWRYARVPCLARFSRSSGKEIKGFHNPWKEYYKTLQSLARNDEYAFIFLDSWKCAAFLKESCALMTGILIHVSIHPIWKIAMSLISLDFNVIVQHPSKWDAVFLIK